MVRAGERVISPVCDGRVMRFDHRSRLCRQLDVKESDPEPRLGPYQPSCTARDACPPRLVSSSGESIAGVARRILTQRENHSAEVRPQLVQ